ncbi:alkaline phosphatase, partial [Rhodothermus marinus]|uniref:alkaline phosphatase n=1 Tax=Rhodothermus marinus TaxID=29549 RepID=UPI001FB40D51
HTPRRPPSPPMCAARHGSEIAAQMLAQRVDVLLGGGWSYFLPTAEGGRRQDGRNLLREAEAMATRWCVRPPTSAGG